MKIKIKKEKETETETETGKLTHFFGIRPIMVMMLMM